MTCSPVMAPRRTRKERCRRAARENARMTFIGWLLAAWFLFLILVSFWGIRNALKLR